MMSDLVDRLDHLMGSLLQDGRYGDAELVREAIDELTQPEDAKVGAKADHAHSGR